MRRRTNSHLEMTIWPVAQTMTRVVSVAGPHRPHPPHLHQRGHASDQQRGEDHPGQVGVVLPRCLGYDDRRYQ